MQGPIFAKQPSFGAGVAQGWQCGCLSPCHPWERCLGTMLSVGIESGTAQQVWGLLVKRTLIPFSFPCLH